MSAKTITRISAEDLEEGVLVDLNEDYIADPDQDLDLENHALVESVETVDYEDGSVTLVTFIADGEELEFEFPMNHKIKVVSED